MKNPLTKTIAILALMAGTVAAMAAGGKMEDDISRSLTRYEHIWTAAPFVAASIVSPASESLAQRYALTGYANLGGEDIVFLLDRRALKNITISTSTPLDGVELLEVAESNDSAQLKAKIRVGSEVAEVSYDAKAAAGPQTDSLAVPTAPATPEAAAEGQAAQKKTTIVVPPTTRRFQKTNVITPK